MDFEITKREVLASISIVAVLLLIGVLISGKIEEYQTDKNAVYNKAIKIDSKDLFEYGMRTNIGNAFVYGDLVAVDPVTYPEIGGSYMYVKKIKEEYTIHTRTVTTRDSKGRTHTHTETYWTWDEVSREHIQCNEVSFCGVIFDSEKIEMPDTNYITTIKESSHVRYKYYGTEISHAGTIFTTLKDKTISDNTAFYENKNIEETVETLESDIGLWIFWPFWIVLTIGCAIGFYYIDNEWLE